MRALEAEGVADPGLVFSRSDGGFAVTGNTLAKGAVVVLVDGHNGYQPVYLASDAPGREVWVARAVSAKVYPSLDAAQRAALLARRRPGRRQPYALPTGAIET
jgi:hypothetical protein